MNYEIVVSGILILATAFVILTCYSAFMELTEITKWFAYIKDTLNISGIRATSGGAWDLDGTLHNMILGGHDYVHTPIQAALDAYAYCKKAIMFGASITIAILLTDSIVRKTIDMLRILGIALLVYVIFLLENISKHSPDGKELVNWYLFNRVDIMNIKIGHIIDAKNNLVKIACVFGAIMYFFGIRTLIK